MSEKITTAGGYAFRLTRRRYGNQWYCWAELNVEGGYTGLGDPWPCATPKASELVQAAKAWHESHTVTPCN
jgi:hypothetical protein